MDGKHTINDRIRKLRKSRNMTGEEFARALTEFSGKAYTRSTINNWETSDYRIKDIDIVNICEFFEVSADSLLFENPPSRCSELMDEIRELSEEQFFQLIELIYSIGYVACSAHSLIGQIHSNALKAQLGDQIKEWLEVKDAE